MKHGFSPLTIRGLRFAGRCLLLGVLFAAAVTPVAASDYYQTFEQDGLKVTIDVSSSFGARGYLPINLDISNALGNRTVEIVITSQRYFGPYGGYYGDRVGSLDVNQTVRLKQGDRVRLTIPLPVAAENENVQVQVRERSRVLHAFPFSFNTSEISQFAPTLLIANPASAFGKVARSLARSEFPGGASPGAGRFIGATSGGVDTVREPQRLPTNWLGFTTLRAIFIGVQEFEELSEAQREAVLAWTAAGGDLIVAGGDVQKIFPDAQRRPAALGFGMGAERYILGQMFFPSVEDLADRGINRFLDETANNGPNGRSEKWFPRDRVITNAASGGLRKPDTSAKSPSAAWQLPAGSVLTEQSSLLEESQHGFRLPIPGIGGVSTRAYLAILVIFTLIIGPANYMYLKRTRQQVLMVLTTPAISAAFIVLLAGYALAGEGFGMHARAETFTFLDQTSKQAATRAMVSLYAAGMAPWNGAQFPKDVAVFAAPAGSRGQMSLNLTDAQQYSSGLMQARTPINFEEIAVRTARERLTFSREGAGFSVVNGLGATIKQLFYRDGGTVYALKDAVPAGGRGALEHGAGQGLERGLKPDGAPDSPGNLYVERSEKFQHFFMDSLADGAFFAVVDRSPFWEPGVSNIVEQGSFHIVAGYAGGEP